jgi:hypothetical protein
MRQFVKWSALLCLSLTVWTGAVEAIHTHPNPTSAASCTICVTAHTVRPASSSTQAAPIFTEVGRSADIEFFAPPLLHSFDLAVRGPPAAL